MELEPNKLRTLRVGGGFEFDEIKTDLHGLIGWEDHNFFGNLRDFSVEWKPGVVLFPFRVGLYDVSSVLLEERLTLSLEQPGFLEGRTTGFVRPAFNVYPLLVEPNPDPSQPVIGYVEPRAAVGARRPFFSDHFNVQLAENIQGELPFVYTQNIFNYTAPTAPLPQILLSYPAAHHDARLPRQLRPPTFGGLSHERLPGRGRPLRGERDGRADQPRSARLHFLWRGA